MLPISSQPKDFNPNAYEGREARRAGRPMIHRYGESAAGREWEQAWKAEDLTSDIPVIVYAPKPVIAPQPVMAVAAEPVVRAPKPVSVSTGTGRRGRPPATGRFETRDELVAAILAHASTDTKTIASDVGVSFMTVQKIIEGAQSSEISAEA